MVDPAPANLLDRAVRDSERRRIRARDGLRHIGGFATGEIALSTRTTVWMRDSALLYRYDTKLRTQSTPLLLVMPDNQVLCLRSAAGPLTIYANLWQSLDNEEASAAHHAVVGWYSDHTPLPGRTFQQIVDLFIRRSLLLTGKFPLSLCTVDLASIDCPVLSVTGANNNLVWPDATAPLPSLLPKAELETLMLPAGHAGLFVGRHARREWVPPIIAWLVKHI